MTHFIIHCLQLNKAILYIFVIFAANMPCKTTAQTTKLGCEVDALSNYIASRDFAELKKKTDDLSRVDSLFNKALLVAKGDYSEALFALIFTAVPYRFVPIQIPLLNIIINYPLVSAGDSVFNMKDRNLPKYLYFDSPGDDYGDKDKVAHFFGAAFLSYSSNFFDLSNLIGYFVEVFEQNFKVQSSIDIRDLQSDALGDIFGTLLKKNKNVLPSSVMLVRLLFNFRYHL